MKLKNILNLALLLPLCLGQTAQAASVGVAATVQGNEISETKLLKSIGFYLKQRGATVDSINDPKIYEKIRSEVLDQLIGQQLLWNAAQKDNILAKDEDVKSAFDQYQAKFDSPLIFSEKLAESGFDEDSFRDNLKQQLSAKKWLQEKVLDAITVSESEIHDFYLQNLSKFTEKEKVRPRHILTKISPEANEMDMNIAMSRMRAIKQELDSGADFIELAKLKSQDTSAVVGGDLGYVERGSLVESFEEVAFSLAPGETSKIFQSSFGLHIVKLVDKKPQITHSEADMKDQIAAHILKNKAAEAVEKTISSLKQGATIEVNLL
ncbi:MAG: peptidylprolyl isomerase [Gammaproteobacteria bacterium]|nr:peptidylprolyl isomerase [Gammaproteobacteria bacterium]